MDSGLYNEEKRYFSTGELVDYKRNENHLILKYSRTKIALEFIKKGIVRVLKEKDEKLDLRISNQWSNRDEGNKES